MGKGGGTHTHILLLATAEEAGGTSGWSGVHRSLLLLFRFLLLFNAADLSLSGERERERGRRVTPQQPACVAHTTQRERDGSRVCPILLLLLAFGGGGERRDIGWLGLCGSIGWCARGGGSMHPFCRGGRRRHTSHHAPATTLVPRKWSTTYCCAVHLSTLIVGEGVCRLCCCCCC